MFLDSTVNFSHLLSNRTPVCGASASGTILFPLLQGMQLCSAVQVRESKCWGLVPKTAVLVLLVNGKSVLPGSESDGEAK